MSVRPRVITSTSASGAQVIDGSVIFDGSSTYLTKTFASAGNRQTFTFSFWVKRAKYGATNMGIFSEYPGSGNGEFIRFSDDDSGNTFRFYSSELSAQSLVTKRKFRDAGWYHICVAVDTNEATNIDRVKIYINGERNIDSGSYVAWASSTWPDQYALYDWLTASAHYIGRCQSGSYFPGYLSQFYVIDGQALEPSEFAFTDPLTNTWRPKKFAGSYTNTSINDGTNWSALNTNSNSGLQPWSKAFNGTGLGAVGGSDFAQGGQGSGLFYWEYSTGIPISSSLRVYLMNGYPSWADEGFVCNTNTYSSSDLSSAFGTIGNQTGGWMTIAEGVHGGSLEKLGCATSSNSDKQTRVVAVEIDGVILIDSADWRGVNSFYLPLDGNTPLGEDQSGKGNNWLPTNLGGSNVIPKATGALPILNTVNGGNVRSAGVRTDAYASNLVFAAPLVGIATDVSNQINSTTTAKAITTNAGSVANYTYSNFYGGSYNFDGGANAYMTVVEDAAWDFGTGDYTAEAWVYMTSQADNYVCSTAISSSWWGINFWSNGGSNNTVRAGYNSKHEVTYQWANDKWYHVAVSRESGVSRLYLNGALLESKADTDNLNSTGALQIGRDPQSWGLEFTGYIQDLRIYKGVAKYTGEFIPASTNPDILPDTPSGVALGSPLDSISGITTEAAVHFDGSGDYISAGASADFALGTGDFTVEMWVNIPKNPRSVHNTLFATRGAGGISTGFNIGVFEDPSNRHLYMYSNGQRLTYSSKVPDGWTHIAVTRESNALKSFINGALEGTGTTTQDYTNNTVSIGAVNGGGAEPTSGYISNFRLIKGTARYTAPFNPPTEPLTAVTNTKLLCCQSPDSAGAATISPRISGLNNGTVWSSLTTADAAWTRGPEFAFNGTYIDTDGSTTAHPTGTNKTITCDFTGKGLSGGVRIFTYTSSGTIYQQVKFDDGSWANITGSSEGYYWFDAGDQGDFDIMYIKGINNSGAYLGAVEVDSTLLLDPVSPYKDTISSKFNPFMPEDINTVMGQETGYATLDPIGSSSDVTLSNGNLDATTGTTDSRRSDGTIQMKTGKWYIEWFIKSIADAGSSGYPQVGIVSDIASGQYNTGTYWPGGTGSFGVGYDNDGDTIIDWGSGNGSYGQAFVAGDTIGMAVDADRGAVYFSNNGRWQDGATSKGISNGSSRSDAALTWSGGKVSHFPAVAVYNGAAISANFGQKPFKFIPPEDFLPLNFANLPSVEVATPDQYVGIATWTGAGNTDDRVISTNFQPDLIWSKTRTVSTYHHNWFDSVRGFGSSNSIESDSNMAGGVATGGRIKSVNRKGITWEDTGGAYAAAWYNESKNYVSWYWKADTAFSNGAGTNSATIASEGRYTATGGFSIVKYVSSGTTNTKVFHKLGAAPQFIIIKNYDATQDWGVYHEGIGTADGILLNTDGAKQGSPSDWWNGTSPDSNVFTLGNKDTVNNSNSDDYIAYCWRNVPGLQKFGTFEGNNSTDGPYVELGFRPAIIMIKNIDATANWVMYDNVRDSLNVGYRSLYPNDTAVENTTATNNEIDFLSNGFKLRNDDTVANDANTYIYAAWADQPMNNLYGGQSNGR